MGLKILGISAFYHDSAAVLLVDGQIVSAVQEERFTRKKHDPGFPLNAVKYCLSGRDWGRPVSIDELDAVVFYDKPLLKFERLLETYYAFAPKGFGQFVQAMPVWMKEKLFLKKLLHDELENVGDFNEDKLKLLFSEHHLSHCASAFYPSAFEESAILTIDGVGEWATASIAHGIGKDIKILKELEFPHSLGLLYSAFTYYTGFKVNSGEYKLMGLAPYGDPSSERVGKYVKLILENIIDVKDDGSIRLNQEYFDYAVGLKMINEDKFATLFGLPARSPETDITQEHCDMALAIQTVTEDVVRKMVMEAKKLTGSDNLTMAGGVALNCVANGKVARDGLVKNLWIQPASGDAGGALGGALAVQHMYFDMPRKVSASKDAMKGSYLGPESTNDKIEDMARKYGASYEKVEGDALYEKVASLLDKGNIVGWHQGRMEWGPRALGARSIIADARNPEMQKKLNLKIKHREGFRPFAPSVLAEHAAECFEGGYDSPYMLLIDYVKAERRNPLPDGYHQKPLLEKLYFQRSDIPSITHLDYSARTQTVHADTNPRYHKLISAFMKLTGYPLIVNTSFNVRGEPIVCTPEDSYRCFMRTEMDYLVVGDYIFDKKAQPAWQEKVAWKDQYGLD